MFKRLFRRKPKKLERPRYYDPEAVAAEEARKAAEEEARRAAGEEASRAAAESTVASEAASMDEAEEDPLEAMEEAEPIPTSQESEAPVAEPETQADPLSARVAAPEPVAASTPEPGTGSTPEAGTPSTGPAAPAVPEATAPAPPPPSAEPVSLEARILALLDEFADEANDVGMVLKGLGDIEADLPQPPMAAQAVLRVLNRRDYNLDELVGHFEKDPALSQTVLRHANSPWYGGRADNPIVAVRPAVQRIGGNGVHGAVMQHVVSGELLRPGAKLDDMARLVWQHMVRSAPVARELARPFNADPDKAFTVALLHDLGKLVFFDHIGRTRKRLRRDIQVPPEFVTAALNTVHEPLGEKAARSWNLAPDFAAIVGNHHRRHPGHDDDMLSQVVYLAERLDIMRFRGDEADLDAVWAEGRISGPREAVEDWLARQGD